MAPEGRERRKFARLALAVDVDFNSGNNFYSGRTRDLSLGGLFVETDVPLQVGAELLLMIRILNKPLEIPGEVAWILLGDHGEVVGIGVRFIELTADARRSIEAFMRRRAPMAFEMLESERPLAARPPAGPGKKPPPFPAR